MKKILLLLTILIGFSGCKAILLRAYGFKKPNIENETSIRKMALKFGLDTANIVSVNSKDFLPILKKGLPEGGIYDKAGNYIEYKKTDSSCNAGLFQIIPSLTLNGQYNHPDSAETLYDQFHKFRDLKGDTLAEPEPADYYVLIYWSVWTGKLNKDHVKIWEDLAKNNANCNVKVIKVNMDVQSYWDKEYQDKIMRAFHF
ncbi:MAG: hypothetical protein GC180_12340 [Bacteroidetes bacterium]|nr:hypothetical protein [Bacteroidota bacterium]